MIAVSCSKDTSHDSPTIIYGFDETGASTALFSVSDTKQIHFSCGNLQYQESDNTWHFAKHQFDLVGAENVNDSPKDLFEWTTIDWGINPIINGGNRADLWRTLTLSEWKYLLGNSTLRKGKKGIANVCGIHGLIILPDNWAPSEDVSFVSNPSGWNQNNYNLSEWERMELSGAIFYLLEDIKMEIILRISELLVFIGLLQQIVKIMVTVSFLSMRLVSG